MIEEKEELCSSVGAPKDRPCQPSIIPSALAAGHPFVGLDLGLPLPFHRLDLPLHLLNILILMPDWQLKPAQRQERQSSWTQRELLFRATRIPSV